MSPAHLTLASPAFCACITPMGVGNAFRTSVYGTRQQTYNAAVASAYDEVSIINDSIPTNGASVTFDANAEGMTITFSTEGVGDNTDCYLHMGYGASAITALNFVFADDAACFGEIGSNSPSGHSNEINTLTITCTEGVTSGFPTILALSRSSPNSRPIVNNLILDAVNGAACHVEATANTDAYGSPAANGVNADGANGANPGTNGTNPGENGGPGDPGSGAGSAYNGDPGGTGSSGGADTANVSLVNGSHLEELYCYPSSGGPGQEGGPGGTALGGAGNIGGEGYDDSAGDNTLSNGGRGGDGGAGGTGGDGGPGGRGGAAYTSARTISVDATSSITYLFRKSPAAAGGGGGGGGTAAAGSGGEGGNGYGGGAHGDPGDGPGVISGGTSGDPGDPGDPGATSQPGISVATGGVITNDDGL